MYFSRVHLINFRPFSDIVLNLEETTLITGRNGSGKTSILEAIHVLLKSRSFRTSSINSLITREKENFILSAKLGEDLLVFEKKRRNQATNNGYKTEDYKYKNFPILINNFSLAFLDMIMLIILKNLKKLFLVEIWLLKKTMKKKLTFGQNY